MKIAFLTTIFPMNEKYLFDFFDSLKNQTNRNFVVIVVNDGYKDFEKIKLKYNQDLDIIELQYQNTPVKNREYGINYCIENGYDILIFGDSDDYFSKNRVEISLELLRDSDIVVNDLSLFDDSGGIYKKMYLSNRLNDLQLIDFEFIKDKNIFGLSNTAIRLNVLKKVIIPEGLVAVDWYFFTLLLSYGQRAIFTNETITYYRQHQENIVGLKELDETSFKKAIGVKQRHYEALKGKIVGIDLELKKLSNISFDNIIKIDNPLWWELT